MSILQWLSAWTPGLFQLVGLTLLIVFLYALRKLLQMVKR
jgi:hypothetical protein